MAHGSQLAARGSWFAARGSRFAVRGHRRRRFYRLTPEGLSLWTTRFVETQLFHVQPGDPLAIAAATLSLLAVASGAAYLPAVRASRIDPVVALRRE